MAEAGIRRERRTLERPGLGVRGCLGVRRKDQRGLGKGSGGYIRRGTVRKRTGVAGRDAGVGWRA